MANVFLDSQASEHVKSFTKEQDSSWKWTISLLECSPYSPWGILIIAASSMWSTEGAETGEELRIQIHRDIKGQDAKFYSLFFGYFSSCS